MSQMQRPPSDGPARSPAVVSGPAALRIDERVEPDGVVVEVAGDVTDETAPGLLATLSRAILRESRVCCDLSAVGGFGATGADVLAVAHLTAAMARGSFSVRGVGGCTAQILQTTGLDQILTVVP